MKYLGDYTEDYADLNFKFSTHTAEGTPCELVGGVVAVYKSNNTTELVSGTLTSPFDGRTGLNNVKVDLSSDAFYAAGNDYAVVITAGTVDAVPVVGTVVALFSIANRYMRGTDSAATSTQATDILAAVGALTDIRGPGATSQDVTIDDGTNPVAGAGVWLTSNIEGTNVVAGTLYTDINGKVSFMVDVGSTYYVWCDSADANFTNPGTWVVVA